MDIREIERMLSGFHCRADSVCELLTAFLQAVSGGTLPPEQAVAQLNEELSALRCAYDGVLAAAQSMADGEPLPPPGEKLDLYVETVRAGWLRRVEEQTAQVRALLERFLRVESAAEVYAAALRPYQDAAAALLAAVEQLPMEQILPEAEAPKAFLRVLDAGDGTAEAERLEYIREAGQYYPWEVQMGLASHQYALRAEEVPAEPEEVPAEPEEAPAEPEEVPAEPEEAPAEPEKAPAEPEEAPAEPEEVPAEPEEAPAEPEEAPTEPEEAPAEPEEIAEPLLRTVHPPRVGEPGARAFCRELAELEKRRTEVTVLLPLMTNLGVLTAEQCAQFAALMNCKGFDPAQGGADRASELLEALSKKGLLNCFADQDVRAYCLSDYCRQCMDKEHTRNKMKGFWQLSIGGYRFPTSAALDRQTVRRALDSNGALLGYLTAAGETLKKKEFSAVVESIRRKNGHYQVRAFDEGRSYICRLVDPDERIEEVSAESLLCFAEEERAEFTVKNEVERIFAAWPGGVRMLNTFTEEAPAAAEEIPAAVEEAPAAAEEIPAPAEEVPAAAEEIPAAVEEIPAPAEEIPAAVEEIPAPAEEVPAAVEEISAPAEEVPAAAEEISAPAEEVPAAAEEAPAPAEEIPAPVEEVPVSGEDAPVPTPSELLERADTPTDAEFCDAILGLLDREASDWASLRTAVVDAVLLARGAGLVPDRPRAQQLSMQLRLASGLLTDGADYSSETLIKAFPGGDRTCVCMELAAYLLAMLSPAQPFDYGLNKQTELLFRDYELRFEGLGALKPLFNVLMSVREVSASGFSPALVVLMGSEAEQERFLETLRQQAQQYLTVQTAKTRMKALPTFYNDCFGTGSDLHECMRIISENLQDAENFEIVQTVLDDFCDVSNGVRVLDSEKIENAINGHWSSASLSQYGKGSKSLKLSYGARDQAIRQFEVRLDVMRAWVAHIGSLKDSQRDILRLRRLRDRIASAIDDALADGGWQRLRGANILKWVLNDMRKYLFGERSMTDIYSDLLYTGVLDVTDQGVPVIREEMANVRFYELWRNALRHAAAPRRPAEQVIAEIVGDVIVGEEEDGLKDNLCQLRLLERLLHDDAELGEIPAEQLAEAVGSANDRLERFRASMELAYTYNRIKETEKETLLHLAEDGQSVFYDAMAFAEWRRFLEALERQAQEFSDGHERELRERLDALLQDARLKDSRQRRLLEEADRLLREERNFAVAEEYITRFDTGESMPEEELERILHEKDYFAEFLSPGTFDPLLQRCREKRGWTLKSFGWECVESFIPKEWSARQRDDSRRLIDSWPQGRGTLPRQLQQLFTGLGFDVLAADHNDKAIKTARARDKVELFRLTVRATPKSKADYPHPIADFGTQMKPMLNVVLLFGNYTDHELVDTMSELDLRGISVVLMIDKAFNAVERRQVGELFHTRTSGQNPFLLIDRVLFLYLAMHLETERLPALLQCTLPYTTYQPFVRDGGSTADEMFCGRSRELATIIDRNGACLVYGGRQLGKTALLERAEKRCSKPESREYAVYSTIIRLEREVDVVRTLTTDIERKTEGVIRLPECTTLREMCTALGRMFASGKISTMHLLIDEVDCFLASIADARYAPLEPLVTLKRETQNRFKFVLTGLHNACRLKNATAENGIFGQLGTPLCIRPLSPTDALRLLSRPLGYLGFQMERYPHLETILTNTNYYPGILQFFGYMLVETLNGQYAKYYRAADGNPPFTLQDEQLGAVMSSADLNKSIKDKFRWSLELDERYFMLARCITLLYHGYGENCMNGSRMGYSVDEIREMAEVYDIHCLEHESGESFENLLDEMVDMGILARPAAGYYFLRRSSFADIIGETYEIVENDISRHNGVQDA